MGAVLDAPWTGASYSPPTAIDIATVEAAIVAQLQATVAGIEIAHYPDRPESYRMTHRVGAALVMYKGAQYGAQLDTAAIIQERRLEFEVTVMMRDLGWSYGGAGDGPSPGAYAILEAIRTALTGFRVPGCRKIYALRERFIERDKQGGVWIYAIAFGLSTVAVEPSPTDNFPLFVTGIAQEEGGETTVTLGTAQFTFDTNGQIQLPNRNVFAVAVTAAGGAQLTLNIDFSLDGVNGIITAVAGGASGAGQTVSIAYSFAERVVAEAGQTAPAGD
jgi:Gp37 protein